ncbi:uncharacterized protein EHS24_006275 [Apiotrichum porosum]|uniref:Uncharacterized protein n=1 Tax=Apiotrichum porosum TaxID=105984 RepID=A0A427Y0Y4_9TREE|nr:uncharacterized protein EHS24_006275 [Apiotrichum porosum]RSH84751.1 hypothetical protein EHS24_006275 [Apiotrichum porosum]
MNIALLDSCTPSSSPPPSPSLVARRLRLVLVLVPPPPTPPLSTVIPPLYFSPTSPRRQIIASRAVRSALVESERVGAEKRAALNVKYQTWSNGVASESQYIVKPKDGSA